MSNTQKFRANYWMLLLFLCISQAACFADMERVDEIRGIVVVTGASGELGAATARLLAKDNHLVLTGRNASKLEKLQEELHTSYPWNYEICLLDYASANSQANFKNYLAQKGASISGLVLITPRPQFYGKDLLQDATVWMEVLQSTFVGPSEALKAVIPRLSKNSKIVVIAGTTSVQFQPDAGPACVLRRMWTTYAKALSHTLGPQSIRINALSPGVVLTSFHEERIQKKALENNLSYEAQMEREVAPIPLRRHAQPEEVAQTIKFLLSEESNFINGINLVLDGGLSTSYP